MVDKQKVIKGLHCCSHTDGDNCIYCPYNISDTDCTALMAMDVLALLKEQEAKSPVVREKNGCWDYVCLTCGSRDEELFREWKYCPYCGQAVKWNE